MGTLAFRSGDGDEGYSYSKEALKLAPNSVPTQLSITSHLANTGRFEESLPYCESVKKLAGEHPSVRFKLGRVALGRKNFREAVQHFESAFKANPRMLSAANNLAWLLATSKDETFVTESGLSKSRNMYVKLPTSRTTVFSVLLPQPMPKTVTLTMRFQLQRKRLRWLQPKGTTKQLSQ